MFSIITPVHPSSSRWLGDTYASLKAQTCSEWEWILLLNSGLYEEDLPLFVDPRVRIIEGPEHPVGVGALKKLASFYAVGHVIVELDADDLLVPHALERLQAAYLDPDVGFVYSNDACFNSDDCGPVAPFDAFYGWRVRPFQWQGVTLNEMVAWEPSPHMMRDIYFAPDHVRSWRRTVYDALGGHDERLHLGDDHDLCCRTYIALGERGIRHIDECLYLYRIHDNNTHKKGFAEIRAQSERNYLRYSRDMAVRWADDSGLAKLDLGGRFNAWDGFTTVDRYDADLICDLGRPWPLRDDTVGIIKAHHIFEHLPDPVHAMNEAYRVLAPGGFLLLEVPSTDGRGAWQDPTHRSFWNENSIRYYTDERWARFIRPAYNGRFQDLRTVTYYPFEDRTIPVVQSDLAAIKGGYAERPSGAIYV